MTNIASLHEERYEYIKALNYFRKACTIDQGNIKAAEGATRVKKTMEEKGIKEL
jgi:hypothetical protein